MSGTGRCSIIGIQSARAAQLMPQVTRRPYPDILGRHIKATIPHPHRPNRLHRPPLAITSQAL